MKHLSPELGPSPPNRRSRNVLSASKRKLKSYVWHYFDRGITSMTCRVCQHILSMNPYGSTSALIWHLERVHGLKRGDRIIRDFSSIPIKLAQSSNVGQCMGTRALQSFEETHVGIWQCKICAYAVQDQKIIEMFYHLKSVHWKATGPIFEPLVTKIERKMSNNVTEKTNTDNRIIENPFPRDISTTLVSPSLENNKTITKEDDQETFTHVDINDASDPLVSSSRHSSKSIGEQMMDENNTQNYKLKMNFPDGNKVEESVVGSKSDFEMTLKTEHTVNLDDDCLIEEFRMVPPTVLEEEYSSNVERAVEYSRKLTGNGSAVIPLRQTRFLKTFPAPQCCGSDASEGGNIEFAELDSLDVRIQVPLQNGSGSIAAVNRGSNDLSSKYEYIKTEKAGEKHNVAVITLNRPKTLNALCKKLMAELGDAVTKFDKDDSVGAIIITGSERAFAAGRDIKEVQDHTYVQAIRDNVDVSWNGISKASKPVIAAVNGYALGGGCELAMMCDIIYAGETAHFGQPEIVIGTIPRAGGTQRLIRAIGKSKAMEMVLTGKQISAVEAEKSGLVSKIFPPEQLLSEAIKLGETISFHSQLIVSMAKEAVNSAYETTLQAGLHLEKKLFCGTFATADQKEGMTAWLEERQPVFKNE